MTILTLLTDFGLQDGYAGIMKGVIWGIAPEVQIADLSHAIASAECPSGRSNVAPRHSVFSQSKR